MKKALLDPAPSALLWPPIKPYAGFRVDFPCYLQLPVPGTLVVYDRGIWRNQHGEEILPDLPTKYYDLPTLWGIHTGQRFHVLDAFAHRQTFAERFARNTLLKRALESTCFCYNPCLPIDTPDTLTQLAGDLLQWHDLLYVRLATSYDDDPHGTLEITRDTLLA